MSSLQPFFQPKSIAVIGASGEPTRIGGRPLHGMKIAGFGGAVYPVNPNRTEVQGYKCHSSVLEIPVAVDLALVALPAPLVPAALQDCSTKRIPAAIVFSSGFAELGGDGLKAEEQIVAAARASGMRIMGPNCMGTMNTALGLIGTFTSTIGEVPPASGHVSVVSQSGAFGAHCFTLLRQRGLGIDLWATTGNQADVEVAECLEYMAHAPQTRVIIGCIEGVRDPARLVRALDAARTNRKAVVLMKLGRSEIGAVAAASHTAALAGSDAVFDSVLRQYGAWRAGSMDELVDLAYCCSFGRFPQTQTLGLATVSGGFGIIMADAAAEVGLDLPPLPDTAQARLRELVPFAGTRNPLDVTAQFINNPDLVEPMLDGLLVDGGYASAILFLGASGIIPTVMAGLYPGLERIAQRHRDRVLAICMVAESATRRRVERMGYLVYEDPTRAVRSLGALAKFGTRFYAEPILQGQFDASVAAVKPLALPERCNEHQAKRILAQNGIPVVQERVATSRGEAIEVARTLGFPVVMKVLSSDLSHKSDLGGVVLRIADAEEAGAAYDRILDNTRRHSATARIDGVLVSPMIEGGVEMILGVARDVVFGPVIVVGLGGIYVEVLRDTVCRVAPFDIADAYAMLHDLKGFALLNGVRGQRYDLQALAQAIAQLSHFAADHSEEVESVDINPFVVRHDGCLALDALIISRKGRKLS